MFRDWACFVQLLDLDLVFENLSPLSHGSMPSLSVDLPENYFGPGFPLNLIKDLEPILTELSSQNFLIPLAQD